MTSVNAVNNDAKTTNGMDTNISSLNACVDLFFAIGASRGKDITPTFSKALSENPDVALRIAAYTRDARGGAGERQTFRNMLNYLEGNYPQYVSAILPLIKNLGRYDDYLVLKSENLRNEAFAIIKDALDKGKFAQETLTKIDTLTDEEIDALLAQLD